MRVIAHRSTGSSCLCRLVRTATVAVVVASSGLLGATTPTPAAAESVLAAGTLEIRTAKATHGFTVEIADTDAKREEGLMFRTQMARDHGMLFDFKREQPVYFWMKNTYLSLDMIFVRADGTILSIAENTTPLSEALVPAGGPVRFVFEVVAGTTKRLGIAPGDRVVHPRMRRAD
ncbi:DUF192 domain-containing protein [Pinisolibacter sp.]|uniref:DUF192 domain-containing protein n=1 Tax=Pinisolibacter sp. TaxID=2172024 RepID=UPI002FDEA3F5